MRKLALIVIALILISVVLLLGCVGEEQPEGTKLSIETLDQGLVTSVKCPLFIPEQLVINDEQLLYGYYGGTLCVGVEICDERIIPSDKVDFDKETVIAVYERGTWGAIEITEIIDYPEEVVVKIDQFNPGGDVGFTTSPYHIIKTSKITKEVRFEYID